MHKNNAFFLKTHCKTTHLDAGFAFSIWLGGSPVRTTDRQQPDMLLSSRLFTPFPRGKAEYPWSEVFLIIEFSKSMRECVYLPNKQLWQCRYPPDRPLLYSSATRPFCEQIYRAQAGSSQVRWPDRRRAAVWLAEMRVRPSTPPRNIRERNLNTEMRFLRCLLTVNLFLCGP